MAVAQSFSGTVNSLRYHGTRFTLGRVSKFRCGSGLDFHRQVDSIENWTANSVTIILAATRRPAAFPFSVAKIPAPAWVHGRHELEAGGIGDVRGRSGHGGSPRFHRLAQRFECLTREFRQFVQKQHPPVEAVETSPGLARRPPPASAACEAEW